MASQERLEYFISAAFKDEGVRQAMQAFGKLNAESGRVVREMEKLSQATRKTGEEIRNSRQGAAQLGMQFNQLGTQVAAGTSPFTAFAQQIGDIGYSMSFMEGKMGAVGRFLAGPWGAAISIAAVALGPLISKLWETSGAADEATAAMERLIKKSKAAVVDYEELAKAETKLNDAVDRRANLQRIVNNLENIGGKRNDRQNRLLRARKDELTALNLEVLTYEDAANKQRRYLENKEKEAKVNEKVASSTQRIRGRTPRSGRSEFERLAEREKKFAEELNAMRLQGAKKFQDEMEVLNQESLLDTESFYTGMETIAARSAITIEDELIKPYEKMQESFKAIGQSVDDAFKNMLLAGGSWRDGMRSIIQSVIDQLWKMYVTQQIVGMVTGAISGLFGGGAAAAGSTKAAGSWIGGFANGTVNAPGGMAWVGERGPELVNLPRGSQVIPAHRASQMGSGGINITVDARGSADPAAVRAQVEQGILQAAPAIIAAAQQRTVSGLRRPRLGGVMQ